MAVASEFLTFLFTDIEGSTALWERHPVEMEGVIARHDELLRAAVEGLAPNALSRTAPGSRITNLAVIRGIAAHDLYHAGQIQLLKRLAHR